MGWNPNSREIESILKLSAEERYWYCIKRWADTEMIWSLAQKTGWALVADKHGQQCIPVWPHSSFALLCATGSWEGFAPKAIPLDVWTSRWLPGIAKDSRGIAVFPTVEDKGVIVDSTVVAMDLQSELEKY